MVREIFVAPNGNDAGSGTLDQPFKSIQTALGRANDGQGGNVFLRGGSYSLDAPVRISDNEGGSATTRLVVQNYQNEKVIIDGSKLAADKLASIVISSVNAVDVQELIAGTFIAQERRSSGHVRTDRDSPNGQLIPRKKITGKTEEQC